MLLFKLTRLFKLFLSKNSSKDKNNHPFMYILRITLKVPGFSLIFQSVTQGSIGRDPPRDSPWGPVL